MRDPLNSKTVSVRVPQVIYDKISEFSKKQHKSSASFIREAMIRHLEDIIDYYEVEEIILNRDPSNYITLEEAMKSYDI